MEKPKQVFISHSSKDRDFLEREIKPLLESHGIKTWYSKDDIQTAAQWKRVIFEGLESCDWFLVALSRNSVSSKWVAAELDWAFEHRSERIVAVIIEECRIDEFHLLLRNLQNVSFIDDLQDARRALLKTWEMEVLIRVHCPNGHRLTTSESSVGKRATCSVCSTQFVIPRSGEQASRIAMKKSAPVARPLEVITNSIGMKLKLIPAGEFLMGEEPQHLVKITKAFYLGVYEVTQRQYEKVMGTRPWQGKKYVQDGPDYPAICLSWNDAVEFCCKLSKLEGVEYRLPTEAQWEYACRAGTTTAYSFGDAASELEQYAWYDKNARDIGEQYAHPVGQHLANPWGLYDMHGNVWEWCSDWYGPTENAEVADPNGAASGDRRVLRGGSFNRGVDYCLSVFRYCWRPGDRYSYFGFRVSRTYS